MSKKSKGVAEEVGLEPETAGAGTRRAPVRQSPLEYREEAGWNPSWWTPTSRRRIEAWGAALKALWEPLEGRMTDEMEEAIRVLEGLKATTVERGWRLSARAPFGMDDDWETVVDAITTCAGMDQWLLEHCCLNLAKSGDPELARRLVAVDEFLFRDQIGIVRAHIEGLLGPRQRSIRKLEQIAWDQSRSFIARDHARDCIRELKKRR